MNKVDILRWLEIIDYSIFKELFLKDSRRSILSSLQMDRFMKKNLVVRL
jgi:hypothetical protein